MRRTSRGLRRAGLALAAALLLTSCGAVDALRPDPTWVPKPEGPPPMPPRPHCLASRLYRR